MSLSQKQAIFSKNIAKLIIKAEELCIDLTFGDAYRSKSQMLLNFHGYKVIKDGDEIKLQKSRKLSKTMNSKHGLRLAVDFNFFINGALTYDKDALQELGDYWESLDERNSWGGNWSSFVDTPHFQMS